MPQLVRMEGKNCAVFTSIRMPLKAAPGPRSTRNPIPSSIKIPSHINQVSMTGIRVDDNRTWVRKKRWLHCILMMLMVMVIVMVTLIMQMAIITGEGDRSPGKTICADRVISRTISGLIVKKKKI